MSDDIPLNHNDARVDHLGSRVVRLLERILNFKDKVLAWREPDFEMIKKFLAMDGILRPAVVVAIQDHGFSKASGRMNRKGGE